MPFYWFLNQNDLNLAQTICTYCTSLEEDELKQIVLVALKQFTDYHQVQILKLYLLVKLQQKELKYSYNKIKFNNNGDKAYKNEQQRDTEMAYRRHVYETAFDCKISRSEDDVNDIDRVTNHPLLITQLSSSSTIPHSRTTSEELSKQKNLHRTVIQTSKDQRHEFIVVSSKAIISNGSKLYMQKQVDQPTVLLQQKQMNDILNLTQNIKSLELNPVNKKNLSNRAHALPPPLISPLPSKFHDIHTHEHLFLNIGSTSSLSNEQRLQQPLLHNIKRSINSILRSTRHSILSKEKNIDKLKNQPINFVFKNKEFILKFKNNPLKNVPIQRINTQNFLRENKPIMEFKGRPYKTEIATKYQVRRELQRSFLEFKLHTKRRRSGFSSTESMVTSSSGGSIESLRSSTSEGNGSISSSESRHSSSLSSHSSDTGSTNEYEYQCHNQKQPDFLNFISNYGTKLHILSPISDKSLQETSSDTFDSNYNNNSQRSSAEELQSLEAKLIASNIDLTTNLGTFADIPLSFKIKQTPNKNIINTIFQSSSLDDTEIQGSDSGISIESHAGIKYNKNFGIQLLKTPSLLLQKQHEQHVNNMNQILENEQELTDLPFDMPKLRRRRLLMQQDTMTSSSTTSVNLTDLPFDMPKLKRRLRCIQNTESSISQVSSSSQIKDADSSFLYGKGLVKSRMTLNLDAGNTVENKSSFDSSISEDIGDQLILNKSSGLCLGLSLNLTTAPISVNIIDIKLPLERQSWYHGSITRIEAEAVLRLLQEGSYLVRNGESAKQDYSLSLKSARGFMHMRIQKNEEINAYILGEFSKPFNNIPEMVQHFSINRLPIRGAEHMCLLHPVIVQLL